MTGSLPRSGSALLSALVAFVVILVLVPPAPAPTAQALPAGLPQHFAIGVGASPGDLGGWLPSTGVPWDFAYQYLSGGAGTGSGWETWNTSGQFPLYYAQSANQHGYVPVFSYYDLLQSTGTCGGCGESQKDQSNINNATTMNAYFNTFALLMKRLGPGNYDGIQGFGKTAVVHVEPDLSGYMEQASTNGDPSTVPAAVASSGNAQVAAYPNTYQGFNWALLHLRDVYAPNVLLAFHISTWATGTDVGRSTDASLSVGSLGTQAGTFAARSGVVQAPSGTSTYDLLFNDVLDRDAAYYKYVYGDPGRWWDRLNVNLPNFQRWETYIGAMDQAAGGKPVLIWQIPVGNQYFQTMNNSNGHYQDNRVEYFFGHIGELQQAGIQGLLFGAGNGGSTTPMDSMKDGVTNPASICNSDGLSSGQVCTTHASTVADDDGGYLRMSAQSYFQHPVAIGGGGVSSTPTPTPTSTTVAQTGSFTTSATASPGTVAPGGSEAFSASVTSASATTVLVDVEVYTSAGTKVFQQAWDNQTFSAGQARSYQTSWALPGTAATGQYVVDIGIFNPGWGSLLAWNGSAAQFSVGQAPTPTPTPLPPTPTPTPTQAPAASGPSFTTSATVQSATLARGAVENITARVRSSSTASALIDIEVADPSGTKVAQKWFDNQSFAAGQTKSYTMSWTVPTGAAVGTYTVRIGIFAPGWGKLYAWNGNAASFGVH